MINRILERLEAEMNEAVVHDEDDYYLGKYSAYGTAISIVQEVANEHRKLNRCDTCTHYVADEVPPICYFCCKGMEDNYQQKGE